MAYSRKNYLKIVTVPFKSVVEPSDLPLLQENDIITIRAIEINLIVFIKLVLV